MRIPRKYKVVIHRAPNALKIADHSPIVLIKQVSSSLKRDPNKLVKYLVKPCKTDVERARAVIRWVGEHIRYDSLFVQSDVDMEETAEAAILRGTTNQHGYLQVFQHIGK